MASAWGSERRLVPAQIATDVKSNEIMAVPRLLKMLALKSTIMTTEALKGNQSELYDDLVLLLEDPELQVRIRTGRAWGTVRTIWLCCATWLSNAMQKEGSIEDHALGRVRARDRRNNLQSSAIRHFYCETALDRIPSSAVH